MGSVRPCVFIVTAFAFAAWAVGLAGISTITNDCYSTYLGYGEYWYKGGGPQVNFNQNCISGLQFQWWGIWFNFIALSFVLAFAITNNLASHQATLTGLLATVTAINMFNSRTFLMKEDPSFATGGDPQFYVWSVSKRQAGLDAAAAGYIMICAFNCILTLLLGSGFVFFDELEMKRTGASAAIERGPPPQFTPVTFAAPGQSPRGTADVTASAR